MASLRSVFLSFLVAVASAPVSSAPLQAQSSTVQLDVYYEALCPDSRRFFLQQLWPTYKNMSNYIDLYLIPYGNAHTRGGPNKWSFTCQHGPDECRGNMIQSCAIEILNQTMDSLVFATCAFNCVTQEDYLTKCIRDTEIRSKVRTCSDGAMGKNLLHQMGEFTDALEPQHTFIPWTTVNKEGSGDINNKAMRNLREVVCDSFTDKKPPGCPTSKRNTRFAARYERSIYL